MNTADRRPQTCLCRNRIYFAKYDTPVLSDALHKAVFNGRLGKVKNLIAADENVYKTTAEDRSVLHIAIARGHESIANLLIDILEQDLESLKDFFGKYEIPITYWLNERVYVVYGHDHINKVKELSTDLLVEDVAEMLNNYDKGLILLLKPTNISGSEVLWLRAKCKEDVEKMARIIQCIFDDGTIHVMRNEHYGCTLLDVAANRYFVDIFFRLLKLFGSFFISDMKCLEYLCLFCKKTSLLSDVQYFNALYAKAADILPLRTIAEIITTPGGEGLLMVPAYNDLFELFKYFIYSVADFRMVELNINKEAAVSYVINTQRTPTKLAFFDIILLVKWDLWGSEMAYKCLQFKPNLLTVTDNGTFLETFLCMNPNQTIGEWVIDHFDDIRKKGLAEKVVKKMISQNWTEAVKRLYQAHSDAREILFRDHKKGIKELMTGLFFSNYEMVEFLVNAHRSKLSNPMDLAGLIMNSVFDKRGLGVLKTLLTLPDANVMLRYTEDRSFGSPFYAALKYCHLENYRELLSHVNDPKDLICLVEDNGENLLAIAIRLKQNLVVEYPYAYLTELLLQSLEIVDSSDDEEDVKRKMQHNAAVRKPPKLYPDTVFPHIEASEREDFNAIFDNLLAIGLDHQNVNKDGQSLLHLAVKYDNFHVVKKLLNLRVSATSADNGGNRPVHGVLSVAVFRELLLHGGAEDLNVRNKEGESPLHTFVKQIEATDEELIDEMIEAGANINLTDNAHNTPLHLVGNLFMAKALLKHGADITATNANGENVALFVHRSRKETANELIKFLVTRNNIDLLAKSSDGVSMLSIFVNMSEEDFAEILPALSMRFDLVDEMFRMHCNSKDQLSKGSWLPYLDQWQPVMCKALCNHTNSYCLKKMLDLDELEVNTYPPILTTAMMGDYKAFQVLLKKNCMENSRTFDLVHVISQRYMFSRTSNRNVDDILLAAGADDVLRGHYASALRNQKESSRILAELILAVADFLTEFNKKLPLK